MQLHTLNHYSGARHSEHFGFEAPRFLAALGGHLGHARLANRMIHWLRRSSPTWLAQNDPEIRVLMKYPG
jgi:hypothetical protein